MPYNAQQVSVLQTERDNPAYDGMNDAGNSFYIQGNVLAVLTNVFGPGTQTRTNLIALSTKNISKAMQLGLPVPLLADVQRTI